MTREEFLNKAIEKHGYKYEYPCLTNSFNINTKIDVKYEDVIYKQIIRKHLMGRCPEKNTPRKTTNQFIKEAKKIWGDKYDYAQTKYEGALKPVKIIYNGFIFEQRASSHLNGLAVELNYTKEYFIKLAKDKWGDKYDYSLVEYKNSKTKVKIIHEDKIYEQSPSDHLTSAPENIIYAIKSNTDDFIRKANEVHNNKYDYSKVNYTISSEKVIITCFEHGDFNQEANSHLQGVGCHSCQESKGERKISIFLDKNDINYIREYKFEDCINILPLKFDFYLPEYNICIEYDGIQHFKPVEIFGGLKSFNEQRINDEIKKNYCINNNIKLLRISYKDYKKINSILNKLLSNNIIVNKVQDLF